MDKSNGIEFTETVTRKKESPFQYVQSKKYDFENVPNSFMQNENWLKCVSEMIDKIEKTENQQIELNCVYSKLCQCILNEMDTRLKYNSQSKVAHKKFKSYKPFWNSDLMHLRKNMCAKERAFRCISTDKEIKSAMSMEYIAARKNFDKNLRFYERQYNNKIVNNLEKS